jgi:two-component system chemotaxis response regulator CheY
MLESAKRLLAIDDDVSSAELIVRIAERCRFEAFATSDSRGVMNLTTALKPSILAVDICMPNLDANDLFELLAKDSYAGRILIVSGQKPAVLEKTRQGALELGLNATHSLQKPLDIAVLRNILLDREIAAAA